MAKTTPPDLDDYPDVDDDFAPVAEAPVAEPKAPSRKEKDAARREAKKLEEAQALVAAAAEEEKQAKLEKGILDRYVCTVHATQPEAGKVFKLHVPHPTRNIPVKIEGRCGVRLEEGLPAYAIRCLEKAYVNVMVEVPEHEQQGTLGLTHKQQRVPLYRVDKGEKVAAPKPLGKAGK